MKPSNHKKMYKLLFVVVAAAVVVSLDASSSVNAPELPYFEVPGFNTLNLNVGDLLPRLQMALNSSTRVPAAAAVAAVRATTPRPTPRATARAAAPRAAARG